MRQVSQTLDCTDNRLDCNYYLEDNLPKRVYYSKWCSFAIKT